MTANQNVLQTQAQQSKMRVRKLTLTAMLAAISAVLMFISFSVPFMPSFIKLDLSEVPALIASFAMGPVAGVVVCLVKNLINVLFTTTGGVGELSNFLLGTIMCIVAGLIYSRKKTKKTGILAGIAGAAAMAFISLFSNFYFVYPVYENFMPIEAILSMYQAINPAASTLWDALLIFNVPFTFLKGMIAVVITMLLYKKVGKLFKLNS